MSHMSHCCLHTGLKLLANLTLSISPSSLALGFSSWAVILSGRLDKGREGRSRGGEGATVMVVTVRWRKMEYSRELVSVDSTHKCFPSHDPSTLQSTEFIAKCLSTRLMIPAWVLR